MKSDGDEFFEENVDESYILENQMDSQERDQEDDLEDRLTQHLLDLVIRFKRIIVIGS